MTAQGEQPLRARPLSGRGPVTMPGVFEPRRLFRRAVQVAIAIGVVVLIVILAPGLGEVRHKLEGADPAWLAFGVVLEALSCMSYVLMFKPIFCKHMPWRTSWEIGWSELAMGSIVPASGAGGLALGAWILSEGGMPAAQIARRSVAFFLLKSGANFVAVAVLGTLMALGVGPHQPLWLTVLPAAAATIVIGLVLLIPRLGPGADPEPDARRTRKFMSSARRALIGGTREAVQILRSGNWQVLLPIPGGLGGIDGGLLGTFVVYGTPAATTAAAVLAYRVILFWLPLLVGAVSFLSLRRGLNDPSRPELCVVPAAG